MATPCGACQGTKVAHYNRKPVEGVPCRVCEGEGFTRHHRLVDKAYASPDAQIWIIKRFRRLIAHMICESLGYFTPRAAANAIIHYLDDRPFCCEWYDHMTGLRLRQKLNDPATGLRKISNELYEAEVIEAGRDVIKWSFQRRKRHKGYMADYQQAIRVIARELQGSGPIFASWF